MLSSSLTFLVGTISGLVNFFIGIGFACLLLNQKDKVNIAFKRFIYTYMKEENANREQENNIGNERMLALFKTAQNREFALQQTAVFCAYRIKNNLKKGDEFLTGQRFGIMRFGGHIDLYLPEKVSPCICVGQTMIGGETIVADFNSDAPSINGEIR